MRNLDNRGARTARYSPGNLPQVASLPPLLTWLTREFRRIDQGFDRVYDLPILTEPPERIQPARMVYADGTQWDPGYGEGPYFYRGSDDTWVPMFDTAV